MGNKIIQKYSNIVTRFPVIVLVAMLLISVFAIHLIGTIQTKKSDIKSMLPQDVEAINTLNSIENEFGSTNMVSFAVEIDPAYTGSNEVRDVRDPRVILYMDQLSTLALHTDNVIEATSPASVLRTINDGRLPRSIREVQEITDQNGLFERSISKDYAMALVSIRTTDDVDLNSLERELEKILHQVPKPPGITASLGGSVMESQKMEQAIAPDMGRTSTYSLIGILIIVLVMFRSIRYGLTPLTTIILGSIWAMGYVGLIGMGMSSQTSGVLSMIMGIGIDFGIQVVTRYRFELENMSTLKERHPQLHVGHREAMEVTLNNVIFPMSTTTLAALIGFQAMSLGRLTFLADMGTMMSYGVAACMVAAITVVPSIILVADTIDMKNIFNILMSNLKVRT
jgi:predicted RND superfamily exporter protein